MRLTSRMLRAGRALLDWNRSDLAKAAGLSLPTINRIEKTDGPIHATGKTEEAIAAAFAEARIEFLFDRGEGVIRLRAPK